MTLLLDTHALLWWREGSRKLGPRARAAVEAGAACVCVAPVSETISRARPKSSTFTCPSASREMFRDDKQRVGVEADVEEREDVGVGERRHGPRLALEARAAVGVVRHVGGQHLERHVAAQPRVPRPIHLAHSAFAQLREDGVRADASADHVCELRWASARPRRDYGVGPYNHTVKSVGSRQVAGDPLADQGRLARTAAALRPGGLAPAGVYRFDSFEEADRWMLEMLRRPRVRRSPKTSPASAAP